MPDADQTEQLVEAVLNAYQKSECLRICGGGSKDFLAGHVVGEQLMVNEHTGILSYEPSELVITARAGTRLSAINQILSDSEQMLGFEPPRFGENATLGGTVACALSGPRRPYCGSARDFVLGVNCINGKGEHLRFGGQVIKNVAGYDVSRLMVGAYGSLGALLEISLKVLPKPEIEITKVFEVVQTNACHEMVRLAGLPLPVSGLSYCNSQLRVRLAGTENGVRAAQAAIGGETDPAGEEYWRLLREQELSFFNRNQALWRISVPVTAPDKGLGQECLYDWGGALRWVYTDKPADVVFEVAQNLGGHAMMFRPDSDWPVDRFASLAQPNRRYHENLKFAFDPKRILNRDIMYQGI